MNQGYGIEMISEAKHKQNCTKSMHLCTKIYASVDRKGGIFCDMLICV
jgi:hypothetical protein